MFFVTFGRLSYADPAEWVNGQGKVELTLRNFQGYVELTSEFGDMKYGWECMDTKVKGFE
jgi:hypothetical protein